MKKLREYKIPELIGSCLGPRVKQAKYSYEDGIIMWMMTILSDGYRLIRVEDAAKEFSKLGLNVPSHDTIGRLLKKLATDSEIITAVNRKNPNDGEKEYTINENIQLNELIILAAIKMGLLKRGVGYCLDIDATLLQSEVFEATTTYKRHKGFTPMVCIINKIPVYISMRSGNANPHYRKLDCIKKCIELLKKHGIKITRARIDGAGYKNEILDYLDSQKIKFVIGANWSERTQKIVMNSKNWVKKTVETTKHVWEAELASTEFNMATSDKKYRITVIRVKNTGKKKKDLPTKWHLHEGYYYKFIVTNDKMTRPYKIVKEYHLRGASERNFSSLKQDFGWKILPFSKLNENLVYMIISAFASNVYQAVLNSFSKKIKQLCVTIGLKKFQSIFIKVCCTLNNRGDYILYDDPEIAYEKIM